MEIQTNERRVMCIGCKRYYLVSEMTKGEYCNSTCEQESKAENDFHLRTLKQNSGVQNA